MLNNKILIASTITNLVYDGYTLKDKKGIIIIPSTDLTPYLFKEYKLNKILIEEGVIYIDEEV